MGTTLRERPRIRTTKRKQAPWQHVQISNDSAATSDRHDGSGGSLTYPMGASHTPASAHNGTKKGKKPPARADKGFGQHHTIESVRVSSSGAARPITVRSIARYQYDFIGGTMMVNWRWRCLGGDNALQGAVGGMACNVGGRRGHSLWRGGLCSAVGIPMWMLRRLWRQEMRRRMCPIRDRSASEDEL